MPNLRLLPNQQNTDLVTFTILVNGLPVGKEIGIVSIAVHKEVNKIPWAKLMIQDGDVATEDFAVSNQDTFKPGNEIEIQTGYHSDETTIFKGIIIKHGIKILRDRHSVLDIECKDVVIKTTAGKKNKYFYDSKDTEVIEEILNSYSIQSDATADAADAKHKEVVQYYATDWDFMVCRAEVSGKLVIPDDGTVKIKKPDFTQQPVALLQYGGNILELEAMMDSTSQYGAVTAAGWNYANQEISEQDAVEPVLQEEGNISSSDLSDVLGLDTYKLFHSGNVNDQELRGWASTQLLKSKLSKIKGRVKFLGFADVKPGMLVELQGVGDRFNGIAFVAAVRHSISDGNWYTDINVGLTTKWFAQEDDVSALPASGLIPAISGLQIGIVTQLENDPDGEHRIQVRVPVIDAAADGIWARVACVDAGNERCSFFRPEVSDEVIVGFINDDPRDAVVLGMFNSSALPVPTDVFPEKDDNHIKGFVTRSKLKFTFDDDKKIITLETPAANKIVINDDEGSILLQDQNSNKITMNSDGITVESAKDLILKAANNVSIKGVKIEAEASSEFSAKGNTKAALTSSGQTEIKGGTVMIN
ncbi:type VI secretion system tip protein VgrG [Ferruginibacter sp.]|nr:type VI secretion system tip protein VgrG [Ferruginibacter sp.]